MTNKTHLLRDSFKYQQTRRPSLLNRLSFVLWLGNCCGDSCGPCFVSFASFQDYSLVLSSCSLRTVALCPLSSSVVAHCGKSSRAPVTPSCGVTGFYGVRIRVLRAYTVASDLGISAQCHRGFLNLLNAFKIFMRLV